MAIGRHAGGIQHRRQQFPVIELDDEIGESERLQHVADGGDHLGVNDGRCRADRVHVALVELAKASPRGTVRAPDRLNLIALEEFRQLPAMLRHHARERDGQVVAQREVGLAGRFVLAAAQHLVYELVALFAVLARQRLDVLERGCLERLESVALVHAPDDVDDVLAPADVFGQEIAHPASGLRMLLCHYCELQRPVIRGIICGRVTPAPRWHGRHGSPARI